MKGWQPIATAPREVGRPLLLYPRPQTDPKRTDGPLLDLTDAAVRRMIRLAKKRGYVSYDELNEVLPSEEFSSEQIEDVLDQLSEMGIDVLELEGAEGEVPGHPAPAAADETKRTGDSQLLVLAIYASVFEGYWDGASWRTPLGQPCAPTHWMPMPSPPLTVVGP